MESLKKILNIMVMVYLLIAFLFLLRILSVSKFVELFDLNDAAMFYNRMLWAGAILLLAELLVENAYIASLKRGLEREHRQITELKAQLYDQKMKSAAATPIVSEPTPIRPVSSDSTLSSNYRLDHTTSENQAPIITPAPMPPTVHPDENPNLPPTDHRPY